MSKSILSLLLLFFAGTTAFSDEITAAGRVLDSHLDAMGVEHHWLSGGPVDWQNGNPIQLNHPLRHPGGHHTHCSAFAAAACNQFGIYLLHPPEHKAFDLANAQYDWLQTMGGQFGWRPVDSADQGQELANQGWVVLAVFKNPNPEKPGHIAIVRPGKKNLAELNAEGPDEIQAGLANANRISLRDGFAAHPGAFARGLIRFYAHPVATKPSP